MQPFHMTGLRTHRNHESTRVAGPEQTDTPKNKGSFAAIVRNLDLITIACLVLAVAGGYLVKTLGVH